jgi:hypothetical protein
MNAVEFSKTGAGTVTAEKTMTPKKSLRLAPEASK